MIRENRESFTPLPQIDAEFGSWDLPHKVQHV